MLKIQENDTHNRKQPGSGASADRWANVGNPGPDAPRPGRGAHLPAKSCFYICVYC
jgi:hypothetical protein